MRRIIKITIRLALALIVLYPAAWIAASKGLLGDVEFGYYREFNVARHAIEESGCAELIEYSGVNKDLFLEEFHFKVTAKSGRVVRLWFDADNMDVSQLCYKPVGLAVTHPAYQNCELYTIERLSELLRERNIQVTGLIDILCRIDDLEQVLKENTGDASRLLEADPYVWDYLRIEFPNEEDMKAWKYTNIKEKNVVDWP
ncbi:MAG: hypothetical protein AB1631_27460 [Acidobacteriota bacterium]